MVGNYIGHGAKVIKYVKKKRIKKRHEWLVHLDFSSLFKRSNTKVYRSNTLTQNKTAMDFSCEYKPSKSNL